MIHDARGRGPLYLAAISQLAIMGVVLRAAAGSLLALTYLVADEHSTAGWIVYGIIAVWATGRFLTIRRGGWLTAVDVVVLFGFLAAEPALAGLTGTVDHASGQLIVPLLLSFAFPLPALISFLIVASLVVAKSYAAATVEGAGAVPLGIFALAVTILWAVTAWMRAVILRVSRASDEAKVAADAAQLSGTITSARRRFAREQWALLHDTAASTLLMVSQGAVTDRDRLKAQAQRDLRAIAEFAPENESNGVIRLSDVLDEVCRECALPVELSCDSALYVPAYMARAVGAATREALTNVERHAGATSIAVDATSNSVTITDDGVGFSADDDQLASHFGVRNSIVGRMRRAGGDATVHSRPASGSVVDLTWRPERAGPAAAGSTPLLPPGMVRAFNLGIVIIGLVVVLSNFTASAFTDAPAPTIVQLMLLGVICALNVVTAVMVFLPKNTWVAVGGTVLLVIIGPVFVLTIPADAVLDVHNWPLVSTAWTLTALLFRYRLKTSYSALAALWVLELGVIIAVAPTQESLVGVGHVLIASVVTQFTALIVLGFVGRAAYRLRLAEDEQRALSDVESVRSALAADHAARCLKLSENVIPLLTGFAELELDAADPQVRAVAAVEASRLRRLVALADVSEQTLASDLQLALDRAEDRGVAVTVDIAPVLPALSAERLRLVAEVVGTLLDAAATSLRLVVMSIDGALVVSVVGDGIDAASAATVQLPGFTVTAMCDGALTWVQIREVAPDGQSAMSLSN